MPQKQQEMQQKITIRASGKITRAIIAANQRDREQHPGISLACTIRTLLVLGLNTHAKAGKGGAES